MQFQHFTIQQFQNVKNSIHVFWNKGKSPVRQTNIDLKAFEKWLELTRRLDCSFLFNDGTVEVPVHCNMKPIEYWREISHETKINDIYSFMQLNIFGIPYLMRKSEPSVCN